MVLLVLKRSKGHWNSFCCWHLPQCLVQDLCSWPQAILDLVQKRQNRPWQLPLQLHRVLLFHLKQNVYHLKCLLNNHRLYTFNFSNFPMSMLLFGSLYLLQVNLWQKHLFSHQLTHNMTKDCSMIYHFSTWKLQAQNMLYT